MNDIPSFNSYIEKTIKENWLLDALTDYKGITLRSNITMWLAKLRSYTS